MTPERHLSEIRRINYQVMRRDFWGITFEELTFQVYMAALSMGDTAIDVGANKGLHTHSMARSCGPEGRVFSFEPVPELADACAAHNTAFANVTLIRKAVAEEAGGTAHFFYFPNEHGLSGFHERPGQTSIAQELEVPLTTLDAEVEGDVALIKLDVEGAEYHALRGARRILTQSAPVIVFENERGPAAEKYRYAPEDFFGYFESLGYNLYFITGMPFLRELWGEPTHPWQFLALHKASPNSTRVLAAMHVAVGNLINR